jgi:hypothetical protein
VIKSFGDKATQALYEGSCPTRFRSFRPIAERKLQMLEAAQGIDDLRTRRETASKSCPATGAASGVFGSTTGGVFVFAGRAGRKTWRS